MDAVCVDVPERQDELQCQRSKRQPSSKPFATNPPHRRTQHLAWPYSQLHSAYARADFTQRDRRRIFVQRQQLT